MKAGATNARLYYFPLTLHHEVDFYVRRKFPQQNICDIFFFSLLKYIFKKRKEKTENVRPISLLLHCIRIFNMTRTLKTSYFHHLLNENNFRRQVPKSYVHTL